MAKHILVCDDNRDILDLTCEILRLEGYDVSGAQNHVEFWNLFGTRKPGLVVLDVRMPGQDGFSIAESLLSTGEKVTVIFMTAFDRPLYRLYAPVAGSCDYLVKPVDSAVLIEHVNKALKVRPRSSSWALPQTSELRENSQNC